MALAVSGNIAINDPLIASPRTPRPPDLPPGSVFVSRARQVHPLGNIAVRIVGRYELGRWTEATGRTDGHGNFRLLAEATMEPLIVRVEVRLSDAKVSVYGSGDDRDGWMLVYQSPQPTRVRDYNVGDLWFDSASASALLSDETKVTSAIFFYAARRLIDRLRLEDPRLAFGGKLFVKFPARPASNQSYAVNITKREVHIDREMDNLQTLFHEMMHIWAYEHWHGWFEWVDAFVTIAPLRISLSTMNRIEPPRYAFFEGFSEQAALEFQNIFFGLGRMRPLKRRYLGGKRREGGLGLKSSHDAERNYEAVQSALRCLMDPDLIYYKFGRAGDPASPAQVDGMLDDDDRAANDPVGQDRGDPPERIFSCPSAPALSIFDIMRVFLPGPSPGYDRAWDVSDDDVGIFQFLSRVEDLSSWLGFSPGLTENTRRLIESAITPDSTSEPIDFCTAMRRSDVLIPIEGRDMPESGGRRRDPRPKPKPSPKRPKGR